MPDGSHGSVRRDLTQKQQKFFVLEQKAIAETASHWIIRGIATTPRVDRVGDIVRPRGARFDRMPKLMLYHDSTKPIGNLTKATPSDSGIPFEAAIPKVAEPGVVRDRIDEAIHSIKYDLLSYVSIGFKPIEYEPIDKNDRYGAQDFKTWDWFELSVVTIPAQPDAVITGIKSIDDQLRAQRAKSIDLAARASSGTSAPQSKSRPGASGTSHSRSRTMKAFHEQIADLGDERQEIQKGMNELLTGVDNDVTALEGDALDQFNEKGNELKKLDAKIDLLQKAIAASGRATPITSDVGTNPERASRVRAGDAVMKSNLPPGTMFARAVHTKVYGIKNHMSMRDMAGYAKRLWPDTPDVAAYLLQKADPGTGASANWAEPLNTVNTVEGEFIAELRPATIVGRLGLRPAPFNTRMIVQGPASSSANWVGNAAAKPVGEGVWDTVEIGQHKIAEIIVLTEDQIMSSHIDSVEATRQDLIARISQFADQQFTDPSVAAGANNPASILNGVDDVVSGGTTAEDLLHDIYVLINRFNAANIPLTGVTLIMSSFVAWGVAGLRNAFNVPIFPGVSITGGSIDGMRVIVSNNVGGSSTGSNIIAVVPSLIMLAQNGGIRVDMSREATIDMAGGNSPTYSLYQKNSVGLRCEWFVSWKKANAAAAQYISGAAYAPAAPA